MHCIFSSLKFVFDIKDVTVRQKRKYFNFPSTHSGNNLPRPFAVRVLRLADETTQDMPYKSFLYIKDDIDDVTHQKKFELVGEVDSQGKLMPGNPNLLAEHQTQVPQVKVAEHADSAGQKPQPEAQAPKRKKRGRPAQVTLQETQA